MPAEGGHAGLKVLLIEDDVDIAEVASMILTDADCTVMVAPNGARALSMLEQYEPDVIVSDLMMPVMDGFTFLKNYRAHANHHAPVLVTSAFGQYLEACQNEFDDTLPKPYEAETLVKRVRRLAEGKRPPRLPIRHAVNDEIERLRQVLALNFDHPQWPELDRFTEHVAAIFDVPICLVSIVTKGRQNWMASCGLPAADRRRGSPRDQSFCTHAVAARAALVVQDTSENPLFRHNVLVRSLGIRFYAGVPLLTRHYDALGTLCLLDSKPHTFTYFDLELLAVLARRVMASFERWERERDPEEPEVAYRYLEDVDPELQIMGRSNFADALDVLACRAAERHQPLSLIGVTTDQAELPTMVDALQRVFPCGLFGRLSHDIIGVIAVDTMEQEAESRAREALHRTGQVYGCNVSTFPKAWMDSVRTVEQGLTTHGAGDAVQTLH